MAVKSSPALITLSVKRPDTYTYEHTFKANGKVFATVTGTRRERREVGDRANEGHRRASGPGDRQHHRCAATRQTVDYNRERRVLKRRRALGWIPAV